jgi:endonuclease/exonuclease/phosphatase family metal-dependent hydrolase
MTIKWSPSGAIVSGVIREFRTITYKPELKKFAEKDEIKIMSFNVRTTLTESNSANNWDNRKEACIMLINDHMPSIIGVQEAKYAHHWTYLKEQLADNYTGYGVNRDTGKESGSGEVMGVLYNRNVVEKLDGGTFWLSETPNVPSKGFGANYSRCATWGLFKHKATAKTFYYINTHLDHQVELAKIEGMKLISAHFEEHKDRYPLFLTGDFNMSSDHVAIDPIESYMYNTREVAPAMFTDYNTTYNGFTTGKQSIIDHIYCSNNLTVVEYHTIDEQYNNTVYCSDHYPVYSIIKLK